MEYFSQFGQDRFIDQHVFRGLTGGTFVEIGAFDGITHSNTYFFEKYRGWSGICIEPNPAQWDLLRQNRSAKCRQVCIGDRVETVSFRVVDGPDGAGMLSGRADQSDAKIAELAKREGGNVHTIEVPSTTLSRVLSEEGISRVDYISIDAEGHDFVILRSLDWNLKPACISMEATNKDYLPVRRYLSRIGYRIAEKLEADFIIVRDDIARRMGGVGLLTFRGRIARYAEVVGRRMRLIS